MGLHVGDELLSEVIPCKVENCPEQGILKDNLCPWHSLAYISGLRDPLGRPDPYPSGVDEVLADYAEANFS